MATSLTIRRLVAGLLLVIFALGITPKRTLHSMIANHKDATVKNTKQTQGSELTRSGFNCQIDNLVCESPFTPEASSFYISATEVFPVYLDQFVSAQYSSEHLSFGLRGPPISDFADFDRI